MKSLLLVLVVCLAFSASNASQVEERALVDFIINTFGLQSVWAEIQQLSANLVAQFQSELTQLLFAGQEKWQQAQQIFQQLVNDLTNHVGNASIIVQQAVQSLGQILNQGGKRGLTDFLVNTFGLQAVWDEIQNVGGNLVGQLVNELTQLLFAGQEKWQQAQQIFQQLVSNLTNHFGDASTIVQQAVQSLGQLLSQGGKRGLTDFLVNTFGLQAVWDEIQNVGGNLVGQLVNELTQLLFAGQEKWQQAQQIFQQLVSNLTNHLGDASTIVQQAVQSLGQLLSNGGRRDLSNFSNQTNICYNSVCFQVQNVKPAVLLRLSSALFKIHFKGQAAKDKAQVIFTQLVQDVQANPSDVESLLSNAADALDVLKF